MDKNKIIVDGFAFTDKATAQKALKEAGNIKYVKENLDTKNPRMVLEMYHKLNKENVFETPVGLTYLKKLQDYLYRIPEIKTQGLEPIQAGREKQQLAGKQGNALQKPAVLDGNANQQAPLEGQIRKQPQGLPEGPGSSGEGELAEWYEEQLGQEKQKRRNADIKQGRTERKLKSARVALRFSIAGNLFLVLVVVGMVVITLMDDHPNIINYENKIIDKYTKWEQELEERERNLNK